MEPSLALEYHSRGGNGLVGVGWTLSGFSQITRCPSSYAVDGYAAPITYDSSDVFCLDGERLMRWIQGYTTEHNTFISAIITSTDAKAQPTEFTVREKGGRIRHYTSFGVGVWVLSRVEDRYGNSVSYSYDTTSGVYALPLSIDYTGSSTNTNLVANRHVKFTYESRPDVETSFNIEPSYLTQRLKTIEISGPTATSAQAPLRTYQLNYASGASLSITQRSLLSSLVTRDGQGNRIGSTDFDWETGSQGFTRMPTSVGDFLQGTDFSKFSLQDLNGDGYDDLLYVINDSGGNPELAARLWVPGLFDFGQTIELSLHPKRGPDNLYSPPAGALVDARTPLGMFFWGLPATANTNTPYPMIEQFTTTSNGQGVAVSNSYPFLVSADTAFATDFDGDGLADMMVGWTMNGTQSTFQLYRNLQTDPVQFAATPLNIPVPAAKGAPSKWGALAAFRGTDFDGDGRQEMVVCYPADPSSPTYVITPDATYSQSPANCLGAVTDPNDFQMFVDFNGDGLDDSFERLSGSDGTATSPTWYLQLTGGPGILRGNAPNGPLGESDYWNGDPSFGTGAQITTLDYNLDNRPDILISKPGQPIAIKTYALTQWVSGGVGPGNQTLLPLQDANYGTPIIADQSNLIAVGDLDGNGLTDFATLESGRVVAYLRQGNKPDMLTRIVDGLGAETRFSYKPTSDSATYTPINPASVSYPLRAVNNNLWVVRQVQTSAGSGIESSFFHSYTGGIEDIQGRGFLGFNTHQVRWIKTDGTIVDDLYAFDNSHVQNVDPYVGQPIGRRTSFIDTTGTIIHENRWNQTLKVVFSGGGSYWTYPAYTTYAEYDLSDAGTLVPTHAESSAIDTVDDFGNILFQRVTEGQEQAHVYKATYNNSPAQWLIDTPTQILDGSSILLKPPLTSTIHYRTTAYLYNPQGDVEWKVIAPGYDSNGNIIPLPQPQPDGVQTRFTHYKRELDGQISDITDDTNFTGTTNGRRLTIYRDMADRVFPTRVQNAVGQFSHVAVEPGFGVLAAIQDENGEYSRWQYDSFGKLERSEPANGNSFSLNYLPGPATGVDPAKPSLELHQVWDAGGESVNAFDLLGQQIQSSVYNRDDGLAVTTDFKYDESHQMKSRSRPHFAGSAAASDAFTYDPAGRITQIVHADGTQEKYAYSGTTDGFHVDHWDALRRDPSVLHSTSILDTFGRLASRIQHAAAKDSRPARDIAVTYSYTDFDQVSSITSLNNIAINYNYDRLGRTISVDDPSRGSRSFGYNVFGEQVTETVGTEVRSSVPDALGRIHTLTNRDGTTTWNWDTAPNGVGKLGSTTSPTGVTKVYSYAADTGQLTDIAQTIGNRSLDITFEADTFGRLARVIYPAVNGTRFAVRYQYGTHGTLDSILDDAKNPFWTRLETDSTGNATNPSDQFPNFELGNNTTTVRFIENPGRAGLVQNIVASSPTTTIQSLYYEFNAKGAVSRRNDTLRNLQEQFDYDELNRLEHWTVTPQSGIKSRVRFDYDDLGNLTGRIYEIGAGTNTTFGIGGASGGGPYAATSANNSGFFYGSEGNPIQARSFSMNFSTFGLPLSLDNDSTTWQLRYSADGERAEIQVKNGSIDDTIYAGQFYRYHSSINGVVDNDYTVFGPSGPIAYVTAAANGSITSTAYILQDYLGSADTILSADTASVLETRKFDPFGNLFDSQNPLGVAPQRITAVPFGFTGHEHDWNINLINMKGRIYDPQLARFLSPDPIGISPFTSLGLNSHAYVRNDPATLRDPTGFQYEGPGDPPALPPLSPPSGGGGGGGYAPGLLGLHSSGGGGGNAKPYIPVDNSKQMRIRSVQPLASLPPVVKFFQSETTIHAPDPLLEQGAGGWDNRPIVTAEFHRSHTIDSILKFVNVASTPFLAEQAAILVGRLAGGTVLLIEAVAEGAEGAATTAVKSGGGAGEYLGGPRLSVEDAVQAAQEHGIDVRIFKVQYSPGNTTDWGSVSQYLNLKTYESYGIVRAPDGRIVLNLYDKGLRSVQDAIETFSHELNHVRGFFKTGQMSSEAAAEAAAEAARPFVRGGGQ